MRCFGITRVLLLTVTISAIVATVSLAQEASPLQTGDFVRITLPTRAEPVRGTIVQVFADTLIVRRGPLPHTASAYRTGDPDLAVPISAIVEAERRLSYNRGTGRGAAMGAAIGLMVGGAAGYLSYEPHETGPYTPGLNTRGLSTTMGALLGAIPGVVIGAAIGHATTIEQWERVDVQARLSVGEPGGGVKLVVRL
jgi:hypothetical protein